MALAGLVPVVSCQCFVFHSPLDGDEVEARLRGERTCSQRLGAAGRAVAAREDHTGRAY